MTTIAPRELSQLLTRQHNLVLIDVRTPAEFAEVHVPQAVNEPLGSFDPQARRATGKVYLLCRSGSRAAQAADQLAKAGGSEPVVVEGGTLAWIEAGLPVKRGTVHVMSLERQVRIAAGSLVLTGVVLACCVHPGFIGLSAFVGAGLVFAGITDWCGMGLLLARAPWNNRKPQ